MPSEKMNGGSLTRRGMLTLTAATSLASVLPAGVLARPGNVTLLGGFEDGDDGWKTNGGNELARVSESDSPAGVTQGTHALAATVRGDSYPMIANKSRVARADFVDRPYLIADVLGGQVSETESDITFKFRYHHGSPKAGNKKGTGGTDGKQQKSVLVEESEEMTVSPILPAHLHWDMSDLDDEALANPKRLEIVWYPTDHPPEGGPRGRGGGFDYRGQVVFDNIRLSDNPDEIAVSAIRTTSQNLKIEHGPLTETTVESRSETLEAGTFVFYDGTTVPYEFEQKGEDRFEYTIDGAVFQLGGGW